MKEIISYSQLIDDINKLLNNVKNISKINENDFYQIVYYNEYIKENIHTFESIEIQNTLSLIQQQLESIILLTNDEQIIKGTDVLNEKFKDVNHKEYKLLNIFLKNTWLSVLLIVISVCINVSIYDKIEYHYVINFNLAISFLIYAFLNTIKNCFNLKTHYNIIISNIIILICLISSQQIPLLKDVYFMFLGFDIILKNILYIISFVCHLLKCLFKKYIKDDNFCTIRDLIIDYECSDMAINHLKTSNTYKPFKKEYINALIDSLTFYTNTAKSNKLETIEKIASNITSEYNCYEYSETIKSKIDTIINKEYNSKKEKIQNYVTIELMYDKFSEDEKQHALSSIDYME